MWFSVSRIIVGFFWKYSIPRVGRSPKAQTVQGSKSPCHRRWTPDPTRCWLKIYVPSSLWGRFLDQNVCTVCNTCDACVALYATFALYARHVLCLLCMEVAYVPPVVAVHNVGIIRICVRVCMPACRYGCMHVCLKAFVTVCMCMCIRNVCMYACMCVCMYVCMYVSVMSVYNCVYLPVPARVYCMCVHASTSVYM